MIGGGPRMNSLSNGIFLDRLSPSLDPKEDLGAQLFTVVELEVYLIN